LLGASYSERITFQLRTSASPPPALLTTGRPRVKCASSSHFVVVNPTFTRTVIFDDSEGAAVLIGAALAYFSFGQAAFGAYTIASALLIIAFVVWVVVTERVNRRVAKWTAADLPRDWERWRTRWEYSHLVRFLLHFIAFALLVVPTLGHAQKV
jgi:hypothetical protein